MYLFILSLFFLKKTILMQLAQKWVEGNEKELQWKSG